MVLLFDLGCSPRSSWLCSSSQLAPCVSSLLLFSRASYSSRSDSRARYSSSSSCSHALSGASSSYVLADGNAHPVVGYGTYKCGFIPPSASSSSTDAAAVKSAKECVRDALAAGYRMFDCAEFYGNEAGVGEAFAESDVPREELYIGSKVWTTTEEHQL